MNRVFVLILPIIPMIIASLGQLDITTGSSDWERCGNPFKSSPLRRYDVELNIASCGKSDLNSNIHRCIWCKWWSNRVQSIFCRCFSIPQIKHTTTSETANGTVLIPNGNDLLGLKPKQLLLICISLTAVLGTILIILGIFYLLIPIYNQRKRMVVRKMTPTPAPIMMQRRRAAPNHYVV